MNCPSHIKPVLPMEERPLENEEKTLVNQMCTTLARPGARIEKVILGSSFLGVVADGSMGLSALLGAMPRDGETKTARNLVDHPVSEAVSLTAHTSPYLISLGFAALNAAITPKPHEVTPNDFPAEHLIADLGKSKIVGLVGEFPFVNALAKQVGRLHLFELRPVPNALPRDQWEQVLAELDVLALTATTLLTRSMAWYLNRAPQATIIVLGPTTPHSRVLFDHGADFLCGSVVTDNARVTQGLEQGLPFRQLKEKGGILFCQWENQ